MWLSFLSEALHTLLHHFNIPSGGTNLIHCYQHTISQTLRETLKLWPRNAFKLITDACHSRSCNIGSRAQEFQQCQLFRNVGSSFCGSFDFCFDTLWASVSLGQQKTCFFFSFSSNRFRKNLIRNGPVLQIHASQLTLSARTHGNPNPVILCRILQSWKSKICTLRLRTPIRFT